MPLSSSRQNIRRLSPLELGLLLAPGLVQAVELVIRHCRTGRHFDARQADVCPSIASVHARFNVTRLSDPSGERKHTITQLPSPLSTGSSNRSKNSPYVVAKAEAADERPLLTCCCRCHGTQVSGLQVTWLVSRRSGEHRPAKPRAFSDAAFATAAYSHPQLTRF